MQGGQPHPHPGSGVSSWVEGMDRGEGGTTNPHVFPEGSEPKVYLLYRPGHYDILYK